MESPWRRTLSFIFIILSGSNVAVFSQNLPPANPLPAVSMRNRECVQPIVGPPQQVINPLPNYSQGIGVHPDISSGRIFGLENQQILVLPDCSPPLINILPPNLLSLPCPQSPPFTPVPQCNAPFSNLNPSFTFPIISASTLPAIIPLPPPTSPTSSVLTSSPLTSSLPPADLPLTNCPVFIPSNPPILVPLTQPQVPIDNLQPTLPLSNVNLPPNFQYLNYAPGPVPGSSNLLSVSQSELLPLENCLPLQIFPDVYLPPPNFQLPVQNYPLGPQYGLFRAPLVQPMPLVHCSSVFPEVNILPPPYQIGSLPPVLPTTQVIPDPCFYLSNQFLNTLQAPITEDISSFRLPINLQINMPESPAPIISIISPIPPYANAQPPSVPPFSMSPIVIGKPKSKWKNWLPAFILALFTNNKGGFGRGGCGSCCYCCSPNTAPENVYIPYPIPIPTNNPIICNNRSTGKRKCDDCVGEPNEDCLED